MKTQQRRGSWVSATSWNPRIHDRKNRIAPAISQADIRKVQLSVTHPIAASQRGRAMTDAEKRGVAAALGLVVKIRTPESREGRHEWKTPHRRLHWEWEGSANA
jgi:hypothetical protein